MNALEHFLLYGLAEGRLPVPPRTYGVGQNDFDLKSLYAERCRERLAGFLSTQLRLTFPAANAPLLSIIIILYNKDYFTYCCLKSLRSVLAGAAFDYEIIIFDNNSENKTDLLLARMYNLRG